ncbi:MAG TPA: ABC transporter permease [Bryobacteraceae bacterium]|nr:ABC transporter permease [Bryobacteraceae bacterium]
MFHFDSLRKDFQFAARSLFKNPGFALVAILALALGIGANSAMFSVIDAILLKPLPYAKPERLVWVTQNIPMFHADMATSLDYWEWLDQTQLFEDVTAYDSINLNLVGGGEPEQVVAEGVTANFFRTLGVRPALGRSFTGDEDKPGGAEAAILTHALFAGRYASNPAILGQTIRLDDKPYTVIGVMPADFRFPANRKVDLLVPLQLKHESVSGGLLLVAVIGRMKPGVTAELVRSELAQVRKNSKEKPEGTAEMKVVPLHQQMVGDPRAALLVLFGAVGLVLLIACGNVANLLLARAADRRREIALRSALGAGRARLIRQLLTESVLLSLAGAGLGLVLARFGIRAVIGLGSTQVPFLENTSINPVVLGFTIAAAIATGILFGLVPAITVSKTDVMEALKQGGQNSTQGRGQRRFRGVLVAGEIALALVLLTGAGLLVKSLWILQRLDPGFQPDHVLSVDINPIPSRYEKKAQRLQFFDAVIQRVVALPGVEAAGIYKDRYESGFFQIQGRPPLPQNQRPRAEAYPVSAGVFRALGLRLLRGRFVDEKDGPDAPPVVDINETMARRHFAGEDPVGRQINFDGVATIVGVVADAADQGPGAEIPALIYKPAAQVPRLPMMHMVVRAPGDPLAIVAAVREQVRAVDRDQPIFNVRTMEEKLAVTMAPRRFIMILLSAFAGLALVLAIVGIYAVMYSAVAQRTNEIGIRMALGARGGDVLRMILGDGARMAMLGLMMGLGGAWAATRLLRSMLFNVTPTDPWTFFAVAAALFLVAMGASLLPARRAMKVDPIVALREE